MNDETPAWVLSRRRFLLKGGQGLAGLLLLAACGPTSEPAPTISPSPIAPAPSAPNASSAPTDNATRAAPTPSVRAAPSSISLDVKIGQMVLVGFRGLTLTDENPIVQDLRERHIGGVVLFDYDAPSMSPVRNIQSPAQVKALTSQLQENATLPLLISTDQEGGQVVRLRVQSGFPPTVSEQYLGTLDHLARTRQNAESMAQALADAGLNLNLAPVVDLNTNPDNPIIGKLERSFSADAAVVTRHALQEIKAHHRLGVLTALKHFPGHGSSRSDSHKGFVDVTDTWSRRELEPFASIVDAGECDAVMTAHIFNARLDPNVPATLSSPTLTGLLRQELHYDGVILSDDMQMGAIALYYGLDTAVESAIRAGVDILSLANNQPLSFDPGIAGRVIRIIQGLVESGKISEARIDQSFQRIMRLKSRLH